MLANKELPAKVKDSECHTLLASFEANANYVVSER